MTQRERHRNVSRLGPTHTTRAHTQHGDCTPPWTIPCIFFFIFVIIEFSNEETSKKRHEGSCPRPPPLSCTRQPLAGGSRRQSADDAAPERRGSLIARSFFASMLVVKWERLMAALFLVVLALFLRSTPAWLMIDSPLMGEASSSWRTKLDYKTIAIEAHKPAGGAHSSVQCPRKLAGCDPREGSYVGTHFTRHRCNETKAYIDLLKTVLDASKINFRPSNIVSYGSSIGVEAVEAQASYPTSRVTAYDIDANAVSVGSKLFGDRPNCAGTPITFTTDEKDLKSQAVLADGRSGYDLVLANNVFDIAGTSPFSTWAPLLKQSWMLVKPGGLLMLGTGHFASLQVWNVLTRFRLEEGCVRASDQGKKLNTRTYIICYKESPSVLESSVLKVPSAKAISYLIAAPESAFHGH
jgi:hypothetical protein